MASRLDYFADVADSRGSVVVRCRCGVSLRLMMHHDAKTAPGVRVEPSGRAVAVVANAWPLPAGPLDRGGSCPNSTDACIDCYAAGIESWSPSFRRGVSANLDAMHHLYGCGGVRAVGDALAEVVRASEREQRARGVLRPVFRFHSDGDVFADWYARAIVRAVNSTNGLEFWIYTRTLSAVGILKRARNLAVYVSADRFNLERAGRVALRHGVPVALLANDAVDASALWARLSSAVPGVVDARPITCPASSKWANDAVDVPAHVVGPDGRRATARKGGAGVGACVACRVCLPSGSGRHVTFLVHGGRARGESRGRLGAAVAVRLRDRVVS
jgi:hypothetical protein